MRENEFIEMHKQYAAMFLFLNRYIPIESDYWYEMNNILIFESLKLRDEVSIATKNDVENLYFKFLSSVNCKLDELKTIDTEKLKLHINAHVYARTKHISFELKQI